MGARYTVKHELQSGDSQYQDRVMYNQTEYVSPWFSRERHHAHMVAASVSQQAFDTEYMETAPAWYGGLSDEVKLILRGFGCLDESWPGCGSTFTAAA